MGYLERGERKGWAVGAVEDPENCAGDGGEEEDEEDDEGSPEAARAAAAPLSAVVAGGLRTVGWAAGVVKLGLGDRKR